MHLRVLALLACIGLPLLLVDLECEAPPSVVGAADFEIFRGGGARPGGPTGGLSRCGARAELGGRPIEACSSATIVLSLR